MTIKSIVRAIALFTYSIINRNRRSKVIYYHDVYHNDKYTDMGTPLELFKQHMEIIAKNRFEVVPQINSDKNQIMICFDDGFRGIWDCRDFFIKNGIKPTIFVAVELIGTDDYLTVEEIKELKQHGFMFESHTYSHINLTKLTIKELEHEIRNSKTKLEELLGFAINDICFPQGYFNDDVIDIANASGYRYLYSSLSGDYSKRFRGNIISRYLVQNCSIRNIKHIILGGGDIFYKRNLRYHYCDKNNI